MFFYEYTFLILWLIPIPTICAIFPPHLFSFPCRYWPPSFNEPVGKYFLRHLQILTWVTWPEDMGMHRKPGWLEGPGSHSGRCVFNMVSIFIPYPSQVKGVVSFMKEYHSMSVEWSNKLSETMDYSLRQNCWLCVYDLHQASYTAGMFWINRIFSRENYDSPKTVWAMSLFWYGKYLLEHNAQLKCFLSAQTLFHILVYYFEAICSCQMCI